MRDLIRSAKSFDLHHSHSPSSCLLASQFTIADIEILPDILWEWFEASFFGGKIRRMYFNPRLRHQIYSQVIQLKKTLFLVRGDKECLPNSAMG
jgi:hypothetical protein